MIPRVRAGLVMTHDDVHCASVCESESSESIGREAIAELSTSRCRIMNLLGRDRGNERSAEENRPHVVRRLP